MARICLPRCLTLPRASNRLSSRVQPRPLRLWTIEHEASSSVLLYFNRSPPNKVTGPPMRSVHCNAAAVLQHSRGRPGQYVDFTTPEDFGKDVSFEALGISPTLVHALKADGITVPTLVQYESLPVTLAGDKHCIIHSETGTGKTLVFLLPALQESSLGLTTLVLVPTRELAVQMQYQALRLAGGRKNSKRVLAVYSGVDDEDTLRAYTQTRPNILIATPKKMLQILDTNLKDFQSLQRLVIDEGDKVLLVPQKRVTERKKQLRELHPRPGRLVIEKLLSLRKNRIQLICTSASASYNLQRELAQLGWGGQPEVISTSSVSKLTLPRAIKHCFIQCASGELLVQGYTPRKHQRDASRETLEASSFSAPCSGDLSLEDKSEDCIDGKSSSLGDKLEMLVQHFKQSGEKSALVFIHRGAPIDRFVHAVRKHGIPTTPLYQHTTNSQEYSDFIQDFKAGRIQLAIATEETVRGLDFSWLNTVYLMEVPRDACDYLHLCGRVGRVGRAGSAVVLVDSPQEMRRLAQHYRKVQADGTEIKL